MLPNERFYAWRCVGVVWALYGRCGAMTKCEDLMKSVRPVYYFGLLGIPEGKVCIRLSIPIND